jgi:LacI family transcriptional regulator
LRILISFLRHHGLPHHSLHDTFALLNSSKKVRPRRVAISLEMDWGFKRHLEVYAGCQRYAYEAGWDCRIHPAVDRVLGVSRETALFDGVIARATLPLADAAKRTSTPLVNVWLNSPAPDLHGVFADFRRTGEIGADHLLGRGLKNFGHLGFSRDIVAREQSRGFRERLEKAGSFCSSHTFSRTSVERNGSGWEQFVSEIEAWIATWELPIGILVCSDLFARYLIDICQSRGLHISQDVSIVSTSNEPLICESPSPTLTSIDMGFDQIGYQAAAMLDRLMDGEQVTPEVELVRPVSLVPRDSTDLYAADDPLVSRALRFIAENSHRRIEVKDVVTAAATNRRGLERKFRDSLGRTIAGEITRLRLERAKRRMAETDVPMKDIAIDAGFRNADHFYKVFLRMEGVPPSVHRLKDR